MDRTWAAAPADGYHARRAGASIQPPATPAAACTQAGNTRVTRMPSRSEVLTERYRCEPGYFLVVFKLSHWHACIRSCHAYPKVRCASKKFHYDFTDSLPFKLLCHGPACMQCMLMHDAIHMRLHFSSQQKVTESRNGRQAILGPLRRAPAAPHIPSGGRIRLCNPHTPRVSPARRSLRGAVGSRRLLVAAGFLRPGRPESAQRTSPRSIVNGVAVEG